MAANLGEAEKQKLFLEIINDISENGKSIRSAPKGRMSSQTFYDFIDEDEVRSKQYARACDDRSDILADEILTISDDSSNDTVMMQKSNGEECEVENKEWINRSKLRVDARKWLLSKLYPKKYGDKIDVNNTGTVINYTASVSKEEAKTISEALEDEC